MIHLQLYRSTISEGIAYCGDNAIMEEAHSNLAPMGLDFSCRIAAGKGQATLTTRVLPKDFAAIAQAMMNVAPEAATKAFGAALFAGSQAATPIVYAAWEDPTTL